MLTVSSLDPSTGCRVTLTSLLCFLGGKKNNKTYLSGLSGEEEVIQNDHMSLLKWTKKIEVFVKIEENGARETAQRVRLLSELVTRA